MIGGDGRARRTRVSSPSSASHRSHRGSAHSRVARRTRHANISRHSFARGGGDVAESKPTRAPLRASLSPVIVTSRRSSSSGRRSRRCPGDDAGQRARSNGAGEDVALAQRACPQSWRAYFPDVSYEFNDRRAELSRALTTFFASTSGKAFVRDVRRATRRGDRADEVLNEMTDDNFERARDRWNSSTKERSR